MYVKLKLQVKLETSRGRITVKAHLGQIFEGYGEGFQENTISPDS